MKARGIVGVLTIASVLATSNAGCGGGCDDVGCQQGVSVWAASEPATDLEVGATYRVEAVADGKMLACQVVVPDDGLCQNGSLLVVLYPNGSTGNVGALLVHISSTPKVLEVRVQRNGQEIGHETYAVEYQHVRVGGGDCEQNCWNSPDKHLVTTG